MSASGLAVANAVTVARNLPDVPTADVARLTVGSYVAIARQIGSAVRRAWWPLALAACLVSRRARRVVVASIIADPLATPTDLAYGWGLWREVLRRRTWWPLIPEISPWPPVGRHRSTRAPERRATRAES